MASAIRHDLLLALCIAPRHRDGKRLSDMLSVIWQRSTTPFSDRFKRPIAFVSTLGGGLATTVFVVAALIQIFDYFDGTANPPQVPVRFDLRDPQPPPPFAAMLSDRIETLQVKQCADGEIALFGFEMQRTPASDTTSGFEGVFVQATIELPAAGGGTSRLPVSGTGKGPAAETDAHAMLIDNLVAAVQGFAQSCEE